MPFVAALEVAVLEVPVVADLMALAALAADLADRCNCIGQPLCYA